jgi:hypothetical protein
VSLYLFAKTPKDAFLIEECADGVFLYMRSNGFLGDTWHATPQDAKAQAAFQANSAIGHWRTVTAEFGDNFKTGAYKE